MSTIRVVHYLNQFFVGLGRRHTRGPGLGRRQGR